jgi:hypothetical protein
MVREGESASNRLAIPMKIKMITGRAKTALYHQLIRGQGRIRGAR